MKKARPAHTVEEALETILGTVKPLGVEEVSLFDAAGRVLSRDVAADADIPALDNSAMDGYAVVHEDTAGASRDRPAVLPVTGEIRAGGDFAGKKVARGAALRIMTGAPIPGGADAVIPFEDTSEEGDRVKILRSVTKGENIRLAGEDIPKGALVLKKGDRLKPADIGLLASLNYARVPVHRTPSVAIFSTGDEIIEVGADMRPGQIRNSNAYSLHAGVRKYGITPLHLGIARDTVDDTRRSFREAMESDIVITTGGVSMGKYDFVGQVMEGLGIEILVETIKMKPGKPCIFGKNANRFFFGLPGNPVSTMVSFIQFVRPAILRLMGAARTSLPVVNAVLREEIRKKLDRTHFIRARFMVEGGEFHVTTTGPQGSGILRSMSEANCLIILPAGVERAVAGERVSIQLIHHEEI